MIKFFLNYCLNNNIKQVSFATSNINLISEMEKSIEFEFKNFKSFIYIKSLIKKNIIDKDLLEKSISNETYISGDVLIR